MAASVDRSPSEVVTDLLLAIDDLDWPAVRACLDDPVRSDYSSLTGAPPLELTADELIVGWKGLLPGFDRTQHLTGGHRVIKRGGEVELRCAVTATHALGPARWVVGGHYAMGLRSTDHGWRIRSLTLHTAFVDGDPELPARATRRAVDRGGRR